MSLRLLVLSLLVVVAGACNGKNAGPAQMAFPPAPVQITVAKPVPIEDATEYVAALKAFNSTTVQPQIEGQITKIFVKSGDHVAQGAPLMQIDPQRQQAAVSSRDAERAAKEADVTFARSQLQRVKELFNAGAVSRQELEQAENALQTAEAQLVSLQAQLQEGRVQLRYFTIAAPTSGVVGDVPVRVGYQVTTSTVLTTVEQNKPLEVYVSVPIERATDLKMGLPLQLLTNDGQPLASTTVSFISPRVDDQTQSVLAKGIVPNEDGSLRTAQFVRARVVWRSTTGLTIPVVAVVRINGQYFAFVAEDDKGKGMVARQRAVKVGAMVNNDYTLLGGIEPNEKIIVSGVQKLADGAPIAPQT
jgi:RND family efflux transporter MFP subunit